ncbi:MAG: hypothetical protein MI741_13385, partial [Rhodospirillales bacterium]|nr:hypothetical protein [Rhodospirillales bacterium]
DLLVDHRNRNRSLVAGQPESSYADRWWHTRHDRPATVVSGYESPVLESSVTYTRDSQYSSHGRVYDSFRSTTYRREYREAVR